MATQLGACPNCRQMNSYTAMNCIECGQRLPWGDAVQQVQAQAAPPPPPPAPGMYPPTAPAPHLQDLRFCAKCRAKIPTGSSFCAKCGTPWGSAGAADDAPSFAFGLLGFLIPIVGFILWLVQKGTHPQRAASAGRGALWGVGASFVIGLGVVILLSILGNNIRNDFDRANQAIITNPTMAPSTTTDPTDYYENMVKVGVNDQYQKANSTVTCTSVTLIKESDRKFTGFAELSDGSRIAAEVVVSEAGEAVWKAG